MNTVKYEKLTLEFDNEIEGYVVIECEKDVISVDIPKKVNNIPVRIIGDYAFSECENLINVTFPLYDIDDFIDDTFIKRIGEHAFSNCKSLEEIVLPNHLYSIYSGAFYNCKLLRKVTFPDNTFVGSYAFYQCDSLTEVSIVENVSEGAFSHCKSLRYLPIGNSTYEIDEDAFEHCDSLTEITIPASIKRIGKLAFRGCKNLKLVHFEDVNNWFWYNRYSDKDVKIDVSDPVKMADWLAKMDFDDGIGSLFRK